MLGGIFVRVTHAKLYRVSGKYHSRFCKTQHKKNIIINNKMPRPTKLQSYQTILVAFFSFKDGIAYDKDHVFDANVRASITPNDVVRYLKKKAYGDPDADVETANPTEGRSSSLEFIKRPFHFLFL